jgi:hypothetical protein
MQAVDYSRIRRRLMAIDVKIYDDRFVTFWDVVMGLAREKFEKHAELQQTPFTVPSMSSIKVR